MTIMLPEDLLWRIIQTTIVVFVLGWLLVQWFGAEEDASSGPLGWKASGPLGDELHPEERLAAQHLESASKAKAVALRQLHGAWLERTGHEWHLICEHVDLEPADVVDILLDDGRRLPGLGLYPKRVEIRREPSPPP